MIERNEPHDEIIEEVHSIRDELSARFGHDVDELFAEMKRLEEGSDRERLTAAPKRLQPVS